MKWSDEYAIGFDQIDEQHKSFFQFADELQGDSTEALEQKMEFLKNYALEHFDAEEAFMAEHGYPDLVPHAQMHVEFIKDYSELMRAFREFGAPDPDPTRIREMAENWLAAHIAKMDVLYAKYIHEKTGGA